MAQSVRHLTDRPKYPHARPTAPQAAICLLGHFFPLYFAYILEARPRLLFAQRLGLLQRNGGDRRFNTALNLGYLFSGSTTEILLVILLLYACIMTISNFIVVAVISALTRVS